jgi:ABC-type lipoprotein release transport system permease subunit
MIIPKLAIRNLLGAGLRTWLNVIVLSFAFVVILWTQGLYRGMGDQATTALVDIEYGGGQFWLENYDPYDPLALEDAHGALPASLADLIEKGRAAPVLIVQGAIYPGGRIQSVLIKGIDPAQNVISLPSRFLGRSSTAVPALIGGRMAAAAGLGVGDFVTLRWRDAGGTFDARDIEIVEIMRTTVQTVDQGQVWIPLDVLRELTRMPGEATLAVLAKDEAPPSETPGWVFRSPDYLLQDIRSMVQSKSVGASILYVILILLAMLAIFDTQVLSVFRRRKEIGTLMALGLTRGKIIQLFTLEGTLHAVLAAVLGALYGTPLMVWMATTGWAMPASVDDWGFAIGERIVSKYSLGLVAGTALLVLGVTTIVSYLPTRRIAKLKPTEALRGKTS